MSDNTTTPAPRRRLTTVAAAASYLDCAPRTVRRYISTGRLTGYRVGPKLLKVDAAELDNLIHRVPTYGSDVA